MKIKHLLSKDAVCKNNILLILIISHWGMSIAAPPEASCSITHFCYKKDFFYTI